MKLKTIYFIPIYGCFKYFNEYFKGVSRGHKEATQAFYIEMYHLIIGLFTIGVFIALLLQK